MSEIETGQVGVSAVIPEQCESCPLTKALSPEAVEFIVKNCTGTIVKSMGCEEFYTCGSPDKREYAPINALDEIT